MLVSVASLLSVAQRVDLALEVVALVAQRQVA